MQKSSSSSFLFVLHFNSFEPIKTSTLNKLILSKIQDFCSNDFQESGQRRFVQHYESFVCPHQNNLLKREIFVISHDAIAKTKTTLTYQSMEIRKVSSESPLRFHLRLHLNFSWREETMCWKVTRYATMIIIVTNDSDFLCFQMDHYGKFSSMLEPVFVVHFSKPIALVRILFSSCCFNVMTQMFLLSQLRREERNSIEAKAEAYIAVISGWKILINRLRLNSVLWINSCTV